MRVRYGKPIKVKSLLGKCDVPFIYTNQNMTFYPQKNGTFSYYANGNTNLKTVNRIANHKYFIYLNTEITYSWTYFGIWDTYSSGYDGNRTAPTKDGDNYYALISPTTAASSGVPTLQFGTTTTGKANYAFILDFTAIFGAGNEPSAATFYNKYKKYFKNIASGVEVSLESGAGQIAYKNLSENNIRCQVSDPNCNIYYKYNQSLFYDNTIPTSIGPENGSYSTNGKEITFTKNENTNYYALTLFNSSASTGGSLLLNCKPNDKILVSVKFKSFSDSLVGTSAGFGACLYNNGSWLRNPSKSFTYISGQKIYSVIDTVSNDNCNNARFKILHTTGTSIYGELFTIEAASIINLTDWCGPGKEPATVQEFKEKFTKDYYGFCPIPIKLTKYQIEALPNYGYNQYFYPLNSSNWISNQTTLVFSNDQVTMTKTGTASYSGIQMVSSKSAPYYSSHKYFFGADFYCETISGKGSSTGLNLYSSGGSYTIKDGYPVPEKTWARREAIFTPSRDSSGTIYPWIFMNQRSDAQVGDKLTIKNMIFIDLTDWYGAGNEPTTIEEFKQDFSNLWYPQSTKRLLNKDMINKLIN